MSHNIIAGAFESRLLAWAKARAKPLKVIVENETYTPGTAETCLRAFTLPAVTDPQVPLEQLSVLTLEGDRYEIRLDLGSVFLVQLDASRYLTIADVWQQLRLRRQYSTLTARRLRVLGVQLADGTASAIHYDMLLDRWGADLDPARNVTSADLMRVSVSLN